MKMSFASKTLPTPALLAFAAARAHRIFRLFFLLVTCLGGVGSAQAAPTMTLGSPTNLTPTSVTLNATVNPNGVPTRVCFAKVNPDTSYSYWSYSVDVSGSSPVPVSIPVFGLSPNTTYTYRLDAFALPALTYLGQTGTQTFTTPIAAVPTVATSGPTLVTQTSATLNGSINPNGTPTTFFFRYGPTNPPPLTTSTGTLPAGSSSVAVTGGIGGLTAGSTCYYQLVATNTGGTTSSTVGSFTAVAAAPPPTVTTGPATNITSTGATLTGSVNPNGSETRVAFALYRPASNDYVYCTGTYIAGSGTSSVAISLATVAALTPGTTYTYRLDATNAENVTVHGATQTFTTSVNNPAPTVVTSGATNVGTTSATLNGSVNPNGSATTWYFQYGTTSGTSYPFATGYVAQNLGGTVSVSGSYTLTGLSPGTTYYYRAYATSAGGTSSGTEGLFTTGGTGTGAAPTVVGPFVAASIGTDNVQLSGYVNPNGVATTYSYEYGPTTAYESGSYGNFSAGSGTTAAWVYQRLSGLAPNTTYHWRLVASNIYGTTRGTDGVFTTQAASPTAPSVTTVPETNVSSTGATLNSSVNPNGIATTVYFKYGTSSGNYTNTGLGAFYIGSGTSAVSSSHTLSNLTPNTTYYYRAYAQGTYGTVNGLELTFSTPAATDIPATVTTQGATSVTSSSALLNGQINPNGSQTTYYFEYGTGTTYGSTTSQTVVPAGASFSASKSISGLLPNTLYYFRLVASNAGGTTIGTGLTLITAAAAGRSVTTLDATNVTSTGATLRSSVNPGGANTTVYFRYGLSAGNYTSNTLGGLPAGSGTVAATYTYDVSGLTPSTTYYYQSFISGTSYGSIFGNEETFTTPAVTSPRPAVTVAGATNITSTAARLNGTVNPNGTATSYYFEYGTSAGTYGTRTATTNIGAGSTAVSAFADSATLLPNTAYHYRLVATNLGGTTSSTDVTFTTLSSAAAPTTTTVAASSITATGATLRGSVNPNGVATNYYFQFGTTTAFGSTTPTLPAGSGTVAVSVSAIRTGLLPNTLYYYRLVATRGSLTVNGSTRSFTTLASGTPAISTTTGYTAISSRGVTLNGLVDPNGQATRYYFQYGKTTSYGSTTVETSAGSGTVAISVSASLTGLTAATRYYYRLVAVSAGGTIYGESLSFVTYATVSPWRGLVDFNGDGYADYVTWNALNGQSKIYYMNGSAVVGSITGPTLTANWTLAAVADCNGDGKPDFILYLPSTRQITIWFMDGVTVTRSVAGPILDTGYTLGGVWDFDLDTKLDFLLSNASGQTVIWHMTGTYGTTRKSISAGVSVPVGYSLAWLTDFDGDNDADYVLVNTVTRRTLISYLSFSVNRLTVTTTGTGPVLPLGSQIAGVMDFNRDSKLDFLLSNPTTRKNLFYFLNVLTLSSSANAPAVDFGYGFGGMIAPPPTSAVITATTVNATSVRLTSVVQPAGVNVSVYFEYGLTTSYGSSTTIQAVPAGTSPVTVFRDVTSLTFGGIYHCRVVMVIGTTKIYGVEQTFWIAHSYVNRFDLNGNQVSDFLLFDASALQPVACYIGSSYSSFTTALLPKLSAGWSIVAFADFNNDGKTDWLTYHAATRATQFWHLNGPTLLTRVNGPALPAGYRVVGTADFNGNGTYDWVLFDGTTGATLIWRFSGAAFIDSVPGPTLPNGYVLAGVADFNKNGLPDWVLVNPITRQSYIWYLSGASYVSSATGPLIPLDYDLAWVGDFDNDRNPDYVLSDACSGQTLILSLNGTAILKSTFGPAFAEQYSLTTGRILNPLPYTQLSSWTSATGSTPRAGLLRASDGNFYGTTSTGGAYLAGTIFRLTPAGALTVIRSFNPASNGIHTPYAGLIQAKDGYLYGTATAGGTYGSGGIFKVTMTGAMTTLHSLNNAPDGGNPYGGLLQAKDGLLYGTAYNGGANARGTIFKITTGGTFSKIFDFTGVEGSFPRAALIQDSAGNFYGTSSGSGVSYGTVFKRSTTGTVTALHTFTGANGRYPYGSLLLASDGLLYAPVYNGAAHGYGGIFKVSTTGTGFALLHSFNYTNGADPKAALIEDCAGHLLGTTSRGGTSPGGTVFRITKAGVLNTLHYFPTSTVKTDGSAPESTLVEGSDGNFYGTASAGGASGWGSVFRLPAP